MRFEKLHQLLTIKILGKLVLKKIDFKMLLLLFPSFFLAFSRGFHTFTVTHHTPFHIRLSKNNLYFIFDEQPPPEIKFVAIDSLNKTHSVLMNSLSHAMFFDTILYVSSPKNIRYTLNFWLIPNQICSGVSHSVIADFAVSMDLSSPKTPSDFCIFSQGSSSSYHSELVYKSGSPISRVEYYTFPDKPSVKCKNGKKCTFSSSSPFFIRLTSVSGFKFKSSLLYKVNRHNFDSYECSFKAIPFMIDGLLQMQAGNLNVKHLKCLSAAEEMLSTVTLIASGIIVGIMVITLLHCAGIINLKTLLGCNKEHKRFNKLKENPYASTIQQDEIGNQSEKEIEKLQNNEKI